MVKKVLYEGIWDTMRGHARRHGIPIKTLEVRVMRYGNRPENYDRIFHSGRLGPRFCKINGVFANLAEHSRRAGIDERTITTRLIRGMTPEDAIHAGKRKETVTKRQITYKGETHNAAVWARKLGIKGETVRGRLKKGATAAQALCPTRWNAKATHDERSRHRKSRRSRELAALGIII